MIQYTFNDRIGAIEREDKKRIKSHFLPDGKPIPMEDVFQSIDFDSISLKQKYAAY